MANNFLSFAGDSGANVLSNAAYTALAARSTGFTAGVAQSVALNKVWRQSSLIAAAVAQAITDLTGTDAVDDGTTANLNAQIKSAMKIQSNVIIGDRRNIYGNIVADSVNMTFTGNELVMKDAFNGKSYSTGPFTKVINVGTVGVGGMDTGLAPISGAVAIYAIFNPTTGVMNLLAQDATSARLPEIYGGGAMPAGYTASCLLAVLMTSSGRLLRTCTVVDRDCYFTFNNVAGVAGAITLFTALNIATAVPKNAVKCMGFATVAANNATAVAVNVAANALGHGYSQMAGSVPTGTSQFGGSFSNLALSTAQVIYWGSGSQTGTITGTNLYISGYTI